MNWLVSYNPATQDVVGQVPVTSNEALVAQVAAAKMAQVAWAAVTIEQRAKKLVTAFEGLESSQELLAHLISQEMGKDFRRASYEAHGTVQGAGYLIDEVVKALEPETLGHHSQLQYRALGVVAVISPWNYPLAMANNLIIPALVAGNAVILKPSENTPLVADYFVKVLQERLPANVLQVAHGDGVVGRSLVQKDINMVAFTGSVATGKSIMADAASGLKRLVMELGGNDPMIVMASADIKAAARFAVASSFENAGQMCTATERVYVDERVASDFETEVVAIAKNYQTGPWNQQGVNIGPLVNQKQHQNVLDQLHDAKAKGANFLLGEANYPLPYIQPTVVSGLTSDMRLEQEETFGPVVAIASVSSTNEAIQRANDSIYGLGAVVFGGAGAAEVADQMDAGMVSVNQGVGGGGPWVGAKQSGFGFHGSKAGHRQFSQVRVINY
jgi:succinate-semialdehyde dehydrogenase/glutarate-semialdehyde dehydrogenase